MFTNQEFSLRHPILRLDLCSPQVIGQIYIDMIIFPLIPAKYVTREGVRIESYVTHFLVNSHAYIYISNHYMNHDQINIHSNITSTLICIHLSDALLYRISLCIFQFLIHIHFVCMKYIIHLCITVFQHILTRLPIFLVTIFIDSHAFSH